MIALRPAVPADAADLARIHAAAFAKSWSEGDIATLLSAAGVFGVTAEQGFALVQLAGGEAELLTIAVRSNAQGQGVGRALLQAALDRAAAAGAAQMHLEVAVDNAPALALYASAAFARVGQRRGYYERPDGRVDALVLTRVLHGPEL